MADNDEKTVPLQNDTKTAIGFGAFKVILADILTFATVIRLATLFEYPPRIIEELEKKDNRNHVMIRYMEEREQIQPTDITSLLNGLRKLNLNGIESRVRKLFEDHTGIRCADSSPHQQQGEGKSGCFIDCLRKMYALWYNKIRPIPYIRERLYCVNDVYVEGGIKVIQSSNFSRQSSVDILTNKLQSFSDIFDTNKISANRILLEGDPGYGKSTFTLQAAYEWCLGSESSPLKLFHIFILIPLRVLGNISSIYKAIQLLLIPANVDLTDNDIKEILNNCSSGVIVLDGYDEYPDKDSDSDVIKIIKGEMFPNFKVVLTSRSLPRDLDPSTIIIRLTGFDDASMYEYIKRAVTGDNDQEAKKIKDLLSSSPVLADICQIPIFCVMFAHVTKEQSQSVAKFTSVTSFFKYIISCFYSHMRNKSSGTETSDAIPDYKSLNKLAFDGLVSKSQQISWSKIFFIETVGSTCYEELLNIGIIIEEIILVINDKPGVNVSNHIIHQESVRFCHKLFAEWYAGNYLSSYASSILPIWLNYTLGKINPVDLQYVFRFASGLNKKTCGRIVRYLDRVDGGKTFAIFCLFEQTIDQGILEDAVRNLLSDETIIQFTDSKLSQRSKIQLLEVASKNEIPIACITLNQSIAKVDKDGVKLLSGQILPKLLTVEKIQIGTERGKELSEDDVTNICDFALGSRELKEISFGDCLLPLSLSRIVQAAEIILRNVKVTWRRYGYRFNFQSDLWEVDDINTVRRLCSLEVIIDKTDSELLQRCTIELLKNASNNEIPISSVSLNFCSPIVDESGLILVSGVSLTILSSLQQLVINDYDRRLTDEEFVGFLGYSSQCTCLKELQFVLYNLLDTIPVRLIPLTLKSRRVKVWNYGLDNKLRVVCQRFNLNTGHWQSCDSYGELHREEGY